jgi:hypothetical protein
MLLVLTSVECGSLNYLSICPACSFHLNAFLCDKLNIQDGVSDVTQRLIDMEAMAQQGLWFAFLIFVLPCCGFFMGFVDLRMKTKARVCCF